MNTGIDTISTFCPTAISNGLVTSTINNPINFSCYHETIRPMVVNNFPIYSCFENLYFNYKEKCKICFSDFTKTFINCLYKTLSHHGKEVAKTILTNPIEDSGVLSDAGFSFGFENGHPFRILLSDGVWKANDESYFGIGIFDLAQYVWNLQSPEVFRIVAENQGIDLSARNVLQTHQLESSSWIQTPESYLNFIPIASYPSGIYNFWPPGYLINRYNVCDKHGRYSYDVLELFYDGQTVLLFQTLQQRNNNGVLILNCELIATNCEIMYNRHLLDANYEKQLLLFDDIYTAANIECAGAIPVWVGDFATMKNSNMTALKNRKTMAYVFDSNNPKSMLYGAELLKKADNMKIALKLYPINANNAFSITSINGISVINLPSDQFQKKRQELTRFLSFQSFKEMSRSDYFESAERYHGLKLDIKKEFVSVSYSPNDLHKTTHKTKYIVDTLFKKRNIVLVYGGAKVGKSTFINDIGTMIAAGETFGNSYRWSVSDPQKVLIMDGEMPREELKYRSEGIIANYRNKKLIEDNLRYIPLVELQKRINLLDPIDREWIEHSIGLAKVLIMDNYGTMMPIRAISDPNKWREVFVWMRALCERLNVSIILMHHTNKIGEMSGTMKMRDDVDLAISLTKPDGCSDEETKILIEFPDARYIYGKNREPFMVEYRTEKGKFSRDIFNADGTDLSHEWIVSESEREQYSLNDLHIFILAKARTSERVVAGDFIQGDSSGGASASSASTVSRALNYLVKKNLLTMEGSGGGSYYLAVMKISAEQQ